MKILAIDDKRDNLTSLKAVVRDALPEYTVLTALNGPGGIELARAERDSARRHPYSYTQFSREEDSGKTKGNRVP